MRYLSLDFETSGLDPRLHAPVTLGIALFDSGEPISDCEFLIGPPVNNKGRIERAYDVTALEVSGATWPQIKKAPKAIHVVKEVRSWLQSVDADPCYLPIVSHRASFDSSFLDELLFMAGQYDRQARAFVRCPNPFRGPWYCTMRIAESQGLANLQLDTLAAKFKVSRSTNLHGAREDAIICGRCFWAMRDEVSELRSSE